ncbi:MAG: L,D-transpeptidase [Candidatus Sericytochromatia bacterium]|nr:L,D-transpeptidase [Candidatus Sericytochromatia bacterium]
MRALLAASLLAWHPLDGLAAATRPAPPKTPSLDPDGLLLRPGKLSGALQTYKVRPGDYLNELGVQFKINPIRITKPNGATLLDGMEVGEVIQVDLRRVTPSFPRDLDGLVVNLPEAHVYLLEKGRLVKDYAVGVSNAEHKAPIGPTRVVSLSKNPTWFVPSSIQKEMADQGREVKRFILPGPENPLGSRWIGFADGTFGFHGTTMPWSIKRYASHGCVRFLRDDIEDLYDRVRMGMRVRVIYQPVILGVEGSAIWLSVYPDYYNLGYDYHAAVKQLAKEAGVLARIHAPALERALRDRDGIPVNLAPPPPTPPSPRPSRSPRPQMTAPPVLLPASPSLPVSPLPTPTATPTASPTPTPTPIPSPTPLRPPGYPLYPAPHDG